MATYAITKNQPAPSENMDVESLFSRPVFKPLPRWRQIVAGLGGSRRLVQRSRRYRTASYDTEFYQYMRLPLLYFWCDGSRLRNVASAGKSTFLVARIRRGYRVLNRAYARHV